MRIQALPAALAGAWACRHTPLGPPVLLAAAPAGALAPLLLAAVASSPAPDRVASLLGLCRVPGLVPLPAVAQVDPADDLAQASLLKAAARVDTSAAQPAALAALLDLQVQRHS